MTRPKIETRMLRSHNLPDGGIKIVDHYVVEIPQSDRTWQDNAMRLAAEVNDENLFSGQIHWALLSQVCRHLLQPAPEA